MARNFQISVRPVTRFIVVEYLEDADDEYGVRGGSECGEFSSQRLAEECAVARGAWRKGQEDARDVEVLSGIVGLDEHIAALRGE